jgi:hypothetical protein
MKHIVIAILGSKYKPIDFLIQPRVTAGEILTQLKVKEDYVLFPASDPARLLDYRDEIYDRVENGSRLIAARLAEASEAYRRSQLYHQPPTIS